MYKDPVKSVRTASKKLNFIHFFSLATVEMRIVRTEHQRKLNSDLL